jgi:hypothetical protein
MHFMHPSFAQTQTKPDEEEHNKHSEESQLGAPVQQSARAKLQQFLLGALAVMLVDR